MGVYIGEKLINIIVYVDDTLLISDSMKKMKKLIKSLENFARQNKLEINVKKTFLLTTDKIMNALEIYGKKVEKVDQIKYLDFRISISSSCDVKHT